MHQGKAAMVQSGQGWEDAAGAAACQAGTRRDDNRQAIQLRSVSLVT